MVANSLFGVVVTIAHVFREVPSQGHSSQIPAKKNGAAFFKEKFKTISMNNGSTGISPRHDCLSDQPAIKPKIIQPIIAIIIPPFGCVPN
ncbi:hypothetical protein BH18ACI4_BH18ACI4_06340 [soil metagenome]